MGFKRGLAGFDQVLNGFLSPFGVMDSKPVKDKNGRQLQEVSVPFRGNGF